MHYLEAVLYSNIDPFELNRVLFKEFEVPVGLKRQKHPWYPKLDTRNPDPETGRNPEPEI